MLSLKELFPKLPPKHGQCNEFEKIMQYHRS